MRVGRKSWPPATREKPGLAPVPRAHPLPLAPVERSRVVHVEAGAGGAHQVAAPAPEAPVGVRVPEDVRLRRLERHRQLRPRRQVRRERLVPHPQPPPQQRHLVGRRRLEGRDVRQDLAAPRLQHLHQQYLAEVPRCYRCAKSSCIRSSAGTASDHTFSKEVRRYSA